MSFATICCETLGLGPSCANTITFDFLTASMLKCLRSWTTARSRRLSGLFRPRCSKRSTAWPGCDRSPHQAPPLRRPLRCSSPSFVSDPADSRSGWEIGSRIVSAPIVSTTFSRSAAAFQDNDDRVDLFFPRQRESTSSEEPDQVSSSHPGRRSLGRASRTASPRTGIAAGQRVRKAPWRRSRPGEERQNRPSMPKENSQDVAQRCLGQKAICGVQSCLGLRPSHRRFVSARPRLCEDDWTFVLLSPLRPQDGATGPSSESPVVGIARHRNLQRPLFLSSFSRLGR